MLRHAQRVRLVATKVVLDLVNQRAENFLKDVLVIGWVWGQGCVGWVSGYGVVCVVVRVIYEQSKFDTNNYSPPPPKNKIK